MGIYTCNNDEQWGLYRNKRLDLRRRSSFATVLSYSLVDEKLLFHWNSLKFVLFASWNRAYQSDFVYSILKQGKLYQNFTIHAPMTLGQVFLCQGVTAKMHNVFNFFSLINFVQLTNFCCEWWWARNFNFPLVMTCEKVERGMCCWNASVLKYQDILTICLYWWKLYTYV